MRLTYTILILLGLLIFASCNSRKPEANAFDKVIEIRNYDTLYSDKDSLMGPIVNMEVKNGVLVTSHAMDKYAFSFLDLNTGRLLKRWGEKGNNGTDEFLSYTTDFMLSDSLLVFMDDMQHIIVSLPVSDILNNRKPFRITKEPYPYVADFRPLTFCKVNGYTFFGGCFKEGRMGGIGPDHEIMDIPYDYPFPTEPLEGIFRGTVFQSKLKANEARNRFVVKTTCSDVFEVYECSPEGVSRICVSPFKHVPVVTKSHGRDVINYDESIAGFMRMAVKDDMFCFLYSPLSSNDLEREGDISDEIWCFDWDGKGVKKYKLPFPIDAFCIDDQYIYGARDYEEESLIFRFRL